MLQTASENYLCRQLQSQEISALQKKVGICGEHNNGGRTCDCLTWLFDTAIAVVSVALVSFRSALFSRGGWIDL
jgi:hypothetical protein